MKIQLLQTVAVASCNSIWDRYEHGNMHFPLQNPLFLQKALDKNHGFAVANGKYGGNALHSIKHCPSSYTPIPSLGHSEWSKAPATWM